MNSKKTSYKIGQTVKIINPIFVVKVGYNQDKQYIKDKIITLKQKQLLFDFIKDFNKEMDDKYVTCNDVYKKLLDELAYSILKNRCYYGSKRILFEECEELYRDQLASIINKKTVKTGIYITGYGGSYEYGYSDCDPPYLSNVKTHVLLQLHFKPTIEEIQRTFPTQLGEIKHGNLPGLWIQDTNVVTV